MHWLAAQIAADHDPRRWTTAPNGVDLDDSIVDGASAYVDVLRADAPLSEWQIEQELPAPYIHPECGGTPDAWRFDQWENFIDLLDLKGGYRYVPVWPNLQLIGYVSAIAARLGFSMDSDVGVRMRIFQPRAWHSDGPLREWRGPLWRLKESVAMLAEAARAATAPSQTATAGMHCIDCLARANCRTFREQIAHFAESTSVGEIVDLPAAAINYELLMLDDIAEQINARREGLRAIAAHHIRNGQSMPHWQIEYGRGRLKYNNDEAEQLAITLGDCLGVNLRKPTRAITPTQAGALIDPELLKGYTSRQRGEAKLTRITSTAIEKVFKNVVPIHDAGRKTGSR